MKTILSRTVQSTPESGAPAGFDGHKKGKGSKVHIAVNTPGHLAVTPANEQDRAKVGQPAQAVQAVVDNEMRRAIHRIGHQPRAHPTPLEERM